MIISRVLRQKPMSEVKAVFFFPILMEIQRRITIQMRGPVFLECLWIQECRKFVEVF